MPNNQKLITPSSNAKPESAQLPFDKAFDRAQEITMRFDTVLSAMAGEIFDVLEKVPGEPLANEMEQLLGLHSILQDYQAELVGCHEAMLASVPNMSPASVTA